MTDPARARKPRRLLGAFAIESWEKASELVAGLEDLSPEQREIAQARWVQQGRMYETLWRRQRFAFYCLRVPIILGAATVPVLAGLSVPRIATALVGLLVAALTGLDGFFALGVRWQQHRRAASVIGFEGWQFLELSGDYAGKDRRTAFSEFLTRLEDLNRNLEMTYLDIFRATSKAREPSGGDRELDTR